MKELKYINFPVSFLRKRDLIEVLEMAILFCCYELMIKENKDRNFFEALIEKQGISTSDTDYFSDAKQLYNDGQKSLRCGVNKTAFVNYISTANDKLNLELRAYCATKALIGNRLYDKTNYKQIFSLMFGYTSYVDMPAETRNKLEKIDNVRSMKKLISKLETKWNLSVYSMHSHGLYISFKLEPVNLIVEVKKNIFLLKNKQKLNEKKADVILSSILKEINDD